MFHNALDLVGRLAAPFEVDPRLHFRDDAKQDEQYSGKPDRRGEQRQRCLDQRHVVAEFQYRRPGKGQSRYAPEKEADLSEKLYRPIQ